MTKTENSEAFRIQKYLMTIAGLWPYRSSTKFYKLYGIFSYLSMWFLVLTAIMGAVGADNLANIIRNWLLFLSTFNVAVKFTTFYFKMGPFVDMVDFLKLNHFSYYDEAYNNHLRETVDFSKFIVKFFFCSVVTTVLCVLPWPLLNNLEDRLTPWPFPLDLRKYHLIVYIFVYLYQCIAAFLTALATIGFDNLSTSMMGISSAYFKILKDSILEIMNKELVRKGKSKKNIYEVYKIKERYIFKQLSLCVSHHTALLEFTDSIENIFTYAFLSQFLCSAVSIGVTGFTIINTSPGSIEFLFAVSFLGTWVFQIALYCFYGNAVTVHSSAIGDVCYMSDWIYCGRLIRQSLFLIMGRSNRPMVLTAGNIVDLSLASLMAILKSATSYLTLLRQMTE